ncbi:MAG TPA: SpoIIE family protein phosphatase [Terriglobales bacterium]|nr:SpoIIE family protein phosphatase [Terriglobales bacterium]
MRRVVEQAFDTLVDVLFKARATVNLSDEDLVRRETEIPTPPEAVLEIVNPGAGGRLVYLTKSPFLLGRGRENDDPLLDARIPRSCAAIFYVDGEFRIEKRSDHRELLLNGEQIESRGLKDGDVISFGFADSYTLVFHRKAESSHLKQRSLNDHWLSMLLEATAMVRSEQPVEEVLAAVVDRALEITGAERGLLLVAGERGELKPFLARRSGVRPLPLDAIHPPEYATETTVLGFQTFWESPDYGMVADETTARAPLIMRACIPLVLPSQQRVPNAHGADYRSEETLLGVLYLDNQHAPGDQRQALADFLYSGQDGRLYQKKKQILNTLGVQAATVLANARLVQRELERQRTQQELGIARRIQQALLPQSFKMPSYLEVTGINRPSMSVGGDYFDVIDLGPNRTAFIVADVSGKGLGAALVTSMLQGTFSAVVLAPEAGTLFKHANRFICEHSEVERYATLFLGTLASNGTMQYINAGHLPALLMRSGVVDTALESSCLPVGLFPDAEFTPCSYQLAPGDTLVLYTDGITEATDLNENQFGVERLKAAMAQEPDSPVEHIQAAILKAVDEFTRGAEQADDITLLILRYRATGPCQSTT